MTESARPLATGAVVAALLLPAGCEPSSTAHTTATVIDGGPAVLVPGQEAVDWEELGLQSRDDMIAMTFDTMMGNFALALARTNVRPDVAGADPRGTERLRSRSDEKRPAACEHDGARDRGAPRRPYRLDR